MPPAVNNNGTQPCDTTSTSAQTCDRAFTTIRLDALFMTRESTGVINMSDAQSISAKQQHRNEVRDFVQHFDATFKTLGHD